MIVFSLDNIHNFLGGVYQAGTTLLKYYSASYSESLNMYEV